MVDGLLWWFFGGDDVWYYKYCINICTHFCAIVMRKLILNHSYQFCNNIRAAVVVLQHCSGTATIVIVVINKQTSFVVSELCSQASRACDLCSKFALLLHLVCLPTLFVNKFTLSFRPNFRTEFTG